MVDPTARSPEPQSQGSAAASALRCDFCGEPTPSVRRIALDEDYERLRTPHKELYACLRCSERKDRSRLGFDR